MKVFVDTNILLDTCLPDRPGETLSRRVMAFEDNNFTRVYFSSLSVANVAYFLKKHVGKEQAENVISQLFRNHYVLPMGDMCVYEALRSDSPDFEDAMQIACADYGNCDCIVTNNVRHFRGYAPMPVFTPQEFLDGIRAANGRKQDAREE